MSEPSARQDRGCFKWGCLGCLGLGGAALLFLLAMVAVRSAASGSGEPERFVVERELPAARVTRSSLEAEGLDAQAHELPLDVALVPGTFSPEGVGRLVLDLSFGEFLLTAGEPGEPVKIEATYDPDDFELVEGFETEGDGWRYDVRFDSRRSMVGMALRGTTDNVDNRVEIRIPRGQPILIEGVLGVGESTLDLGGLWIRAVDLELGTGEYEITFYEPGPAPMESFRVAAGIGELRVEELGNASPAEIDVEQRIGSLQLELDGRWQNDATAKVRCGIGECNVALPDGVRVVIGRTSMGLGERSVRLPDEADLPEGAPTLELSVRGSIGELRVH